MAGDRCARGHPDARASTVSVPHRAFGKDRQRNTLLAGVADDRHVARLPPRPHERLVDHAKVSARELFVGRSEHRLPKSDQRRDRDHRQAAVPHQGDHAHHDRPEDLAERAQPGRRGGRGREGRAGVAESGGSGSVGKQRAHHRSRGRDHARGSTRPARARHQPPPPRPRTGLPAARSRPRCRYRARPDQGQRDWAERTGPGSHPRAARRDPRPRSRRGSRRGSARGARSDVGDPRPRTGAPRTGRSCNPGLERHVDRRATTVARPPGNAPRWAPRRPPSSSRRSRGARRPPCPSRRSTPARRGFAPRSGVDRRPASFEPAATAPSTARARVRARARGPARAPAQVPNRALAPERSAPRSAGR